MPLHDRIRARVREKDCYFAVFPENGLSVLSPMNNDVFPVPNSNTTGNKDIDDGLANMRHCTPATGDVFEFISGNYGAQVVSTVNLSGQTPHHTLIFKAFVTDLTSIEEYPYFYRVGITFMGGTAYLNHANFTCSIELNGQFNSFGIQSYATFQNADEFAQQSSSATRCVGAVHKDYPRADLSGRWLTVAATVDYETKTHSIYFNGELVDSAIRESWTDDRNMFSYKGPSEAFSLGHKYAGEEFFGIYSKIAWGACFSSVLSPEEIKYLSEE